MSFNDLPRFSRWRALNALVTMCCFSSAAIALDQNTSLEEYYKSTYGSNVYDAIESQYKSNNCRLISGKTDLAAIIGENQYNALPSSVKSVIDKQAANVQEAFSQARAYTGIQFVDGQGNSVAANVIAAAYKAGVGEKFNRFFKKGNKTLIFAHGWQPGKVSPDGVCTLERLHFAYYLHKDDIVSGKVIPRKLSEAQIRAIENNHHVNLPDAPETAAEAWIKDGYNVGLFFWAQYADTVDDDIASQVVGAITNGTFGIGTKQANTDQPYDDLLRRAMVDDAERKIYIGDGPVFMGNYNVVPVDNQQVCHKTQHYKIKTTSLFTRLGLSIDLRAVNWWIQNEGSWWWPKYYTHYKINAHDGNLLSRVKSDGAFRLVESNVSPRVCANTVVKASKPVFVNVRMTWKDVASQKRVGGINDSRSVPEYLPVRTQYREAYENFFETVYADGSGADIIISGSSLGSQLSVALGHSLIMGEERGLPKATLRSNDGYRFYDSNCVSGSQIDTSKSTCVHRKAPIRKNLQPKRIVMLDPYFGNNAHWYYVKMFQADRDARHTTFHPRDTMGNMDKSQVRTGSNAYAMTSAELIESYVANLLNNNTKQASSNDKVGIAVYRSSPVTKAKLAMPLDALEDTVKDVANSIINFATFGLIGEAFEKGEMQPLVVADENVDVLSSVAFVQLKAHDKHAVGGSPTRKDDLLSLVGKHGYPVTFFHASTMFDSFGNKPNAQRSHEALLNAHGTYLLQTAGSKHVGDFANDQFVKVSTSKDGMSYHQGKIGEYYQDVTFDYGGVGSSFLTTVFDGIKNGGF